MVRESRVRGVDWLGLSWDKSLELHFELKFVGYQRGYRGMIFIIWLEGLRLATAICYNLYR